MMLKDLEKEARALEGAIEGWAHSTLDAEKCKELFRILDEHATACNRIKDQIYNRFRIAREIERNGIKRAERHP